MGFMIRCFLILTVNNAKIDFPVLSHTFPLKKYFTTKFVWKKYPAFIITFSKDRDNKLQWANTASAFLNDMMTMGVPYNITEIEEVPGCIRVTWGHALACPAADPGMVFTVQSQLGLPVLGHLIVFSTAQLPPFNTALFLIGHLCRHGDNSCLWDEEATFGVPASLTACNWRIPKSLMAFKTHAHRRAFGL